MSVIVSVTKLYKAFGTNKVLQGASVAFQKGEITAIIGQSGTGKSVLLKNIIGILKPDSGEIFFEGKTITNASRKEWNKIRLRFGYLFQDSALFDSLTVEENIAFPLVETLGERNKNKIARIVEEKLKWIDLPGLYRASILPSFQGECVNVWG